MKIYNTLSGKKEILPKSARKPLGLFVCGPTVYDLSHIGHARTYIFFDIFARYLKNLGYKVFYLQNITDIDDKIIKRARKKGISSSSLAAQETRAYLRDMKTLGINQVKYAPATKFIPQIVRQVEALIKKSYAYEIPGDGYYFDISKFRDYGKLSRRTIEQAEDAVSRIDESVKKKNKGDFALWKFPQARINADLNADKRGKKFMVLEGEPLWKTSLGWGRPGWHIEDTAITEKFFGPQYELHGGGLDLKFPHHEAEIAQAEAASGKKPFVKIWMHVGMLTVHGAKMSKSLGNFIAIRDFLKKYSPNILRFIVTGTHYRSPIDYREAVAESARQTLTSLEEFAAKLKLIKISNIPPQRGKASTMKLVNKIQKYERQFQKSMADDINTPEALAAIFDLINYVNKSIWNLNKNEALAIKKWMLNKLNIFGIKLKRPQIPEKIQNSVKKRELLRTNKQFTQADTSRKKIEALGYKIEDTPLGPMVLKNF